MHVFVFVGLKIVCVCVCVDTNCVVCMDCTMCCCVSGLKTVCGVICTVPCVMCGLSVV